MFSVTRTLWLIIAVSLAIHVLTLLVGQLWLYDWRWPHHALHASIEMSGSIIALVVSVFLIYFQRSGRGTSYNMQIAAALCCMGILDGFHAMVHVGEAFVWLHSMATFLAGLCFFSIFFPARWSFFTSVAWPVSAGLFAILFGVITLVFHHQVPSMVQQGEFTALAKGLNFIGGVMLFIAALGLVQSYFRTNLINDLLFCLHCSLFGAAAIMFEQSELWDLAWWGWHLLRFLAYMVALWFVFRDESLLLTDLSRHRDSLDLLVDERTAQLQQSNQQLERALQHLHKTQLQPLEDSTRSNLNHLFEEMGYELNNPLTQAIAESNQIAPCLDNLQQGLQQQSRSISEVERTLSQLEQHDKQLRMHLSEAAQRLNELKKTALDSADLNKVAIDMRAFVESEMSRFEAQLAERSISLKLTCPEPVSICSYPGALSQVISSLTRNSLEHAFEDADVGLIKVDIRADEDRVQLSYSDNGCGIESHLFDRVFEPFFTTAYGDNSGLGLYFCRNLVNQKLSGQLGCKSKRGAGTLFTLTLPFDIDDYSIYSTD